MNRIKFELFISEQHDRGLCSRFTDGNGQSTVSWWSAPPQNINNAALSYLKERHANVKTSDHANIIRKQFVHQMANDFQHVGMNVYKRITPLDADGTPTEPPAAAQADARAERIRQLSVRVLISQGENFTGLLFRDGEQIGNIGSDNRQFFINLAVEPTLSETVDILQFAENLNPIFQTHKFELRVRTGMLA